MFYYTTLLGLSLEIIYSYHITYRGHSNGRDELPCHTEYDLTIDIVKLEGIREIKLSPLRLSNLLAEMMESEEIHDDILAEENLAY
jgi:hypothetical protein